MASARPGMAAWWCDVSVGIPWYPRHRIDTARAVGKGVTDAELAWLLNRASPLLCPWPSQHGQDQMDLDPAAPGAFSLSLPTLDHLPAI